MAQDPNAGTAGGSAQREYERRRAKDEARIRDTWGQGRIGSIAVALTPERQSTTAWRGGANGEKEVGAALDYLAGESIKVLHDRRIPRSKANIDHIAITPQGVWVVDAKRYKNQRPALRVDGGIFRPRTELLVVGGRDKTSLIESMYKQVERVRDVVGEVPVRGVLCFVDADWPLFGGDFVIRGVEVLWPRLLQKRVGAAGDTVCDVAETAATIAGVFGPALR
ncbi:nuclease-related domain-containing protein [Protaetiibacter larvae]|uniref:nuclease-related domain-containing protein n=1 Tax=Protaetiibacter larvae TaxID=2592654 RepID=UPI001FEBAC5F|nr:nuclease-related domain-containing protein [Protaetiibacter larvae]